MRQWSDAVLVPERTTNAAIHLRIARAERDNTLGRLDRHRGACLLCTNSAETREKYELNMRTVKPV
jgi:hypothetical protein